MSPLQLLEIVLYVAEPALAAEFLQKVAGMKLLEAAPDFHVVATREGLRVALRPAALHGQAADGSTLAGPSLPGAELVLAADDVARAHDQATALGATSLLPATTLAYGQVATVRGPGELRLTFFTRRSR